MDEKPVKYEQNPGQANGGKTSRQPDRFIRFKCKRCSRKFKDMKLLHDHLQSHKHKGKTGKYTCKVCPAIFDDFFDWIRHKKSHRKTLKVEKRITLNNNDGNTNANDLREATTNSVTSSAAQNGRQTEETHDHKPLHGGTGRHEDLDISRGIGSSSYQVHIEPGSSPRIPVATHMTHFPYDPKSVHEAYRPFENFVKIVGDDTLQIDSPSPVKSIFLNTSSPELQSVINQIKVVNSKLDAIIRHFNVPLDFPQAPEYTCTDKKNQSNTVKPSPMDISTYSKLHTATPCYSSPKENESQEYFASSVPHAGVKIWPQVTSPTVYSSSPVYSFNKEEHDNKGSKTCNVTSPVITTVSLGGTKLSCEGGKDFRLSEELIEKLFVVSRSRGNFAKNLSFAVYSPDERQGRNCTGRVFGKAVPKGQLDQTKLNYVKELTFQKYPCHPSLVDITWKKKCVTAIDSGLRNEHRVRTRKFGPTQEGLSHTF